MTNDEIRAAVAASFRQIAPDVDLASVDPVEDLREEADIDSMDFLNVLMELEKRTGVAIPEADYGEVDTLEKLLAYVAARAA